MAKFEELEASEDWSTEWDDEGRDKPLRDDFLLSREDYDETAAVILEPHQAGLVGRIEFEQKILENGRSILLRFPTELEQHGFLGCNAVASLVVKSPWCPNTVITIGIASRDTFVVPDTMIEAWNKLNISLEAQGEMLATAFLSAKINRYIAERRLSQATPLSLILENVIAQQVKALPQLGEPFEMQTELPPQ